MIKLCCGEPRPDTYLYRNWPHCICSQLIGHRGEHQFDRRDDVSFAWPDERNPRSAHIATLRSEKPQVRP
jgi:hypothetical protein